MTERFVNLFFALLLAAATLIVVLRPHDPAPPEPAPVPPVPATSSVRLLFAGDLMQHMPQVQAARTADGFDYTTCFRYVRDRFRRADLAVVNLETTLCATGNYAGYPCFRSPVSLADALRDLGVNVALLANNHCCDGGLRGVRTTVDALDERGIRHTGMFSDSTDYQTNNPLYLERNGIRIALVNYTYSTNGLPVPRPALVNPLDTVRMAADLARIDRDSVDCIVACVHWGNEYERHPDAQQRRMAGFLRRHGVDLIVGSHPHVVQPFERDSAGVTLFSLGNFVSNQRKRHTDGGLLAEIVVTRTAGEPLRYDLEITPVWVLCPGYRILPPEVGDTLAMPAPARAAYERFMEDTRAHTGL